jgi:alpha-tubulin suppressor-like RCC1 family protein
MSTGRIALALLALFSLTACSDEALVSSRPVPEPVVPMQTLAALRCRVDARAGTMECGDAVPASSGASRLIVGGQHRYVRLTNSGAFYNGDVDSLYTFVSISNLLIAPLGTTDGTTPHADGVRIFFETEPTNGVTVGNADGIATYLSSGKPYFQYSGGALGADGILSSDEESSELEWKFAMNGATSFVFVVYVAAEIPTGASYTIHMTGLAAGTATSCGRVTGGAAYCWGTDDREQLGNGLASGDRGVPYPVVMPGGMTFDTVAVGRYHACGLTSTGLAFCWGGDATGQLGNGAGAPVDQPIPVPVLMPGGTTFTRIGAAEFDTCALDQNGNGWCWGNDGNGRLGNGPALVDQQESPSAVTMPGGLTFTRITAAYNHNCAVASNGAAYCWGWDSNGRLGNGSTGGVDRDVPTQVSLPGVPFADISAGHDHTCGLDAGGMAWCWGSDTFGQLGNGPGLTADQYLPTPVIMPGGVTFTAISAGGQHTCALGSDNQTYCWGSDASGQLGNGDGLTANQDSPSPVQSPGTAFVIISAGNQHTCGITSGAAFCWGDNSNRTLGDGSFIPRTAPVYVAATR